MDEAEERADLISRMFALLTAKLEDVAGMAADCQGRRPIEELRTNSDALQSMITEAATVSAAIAALLQEADSG